MFEQVIQYNLVWGSLRLINHEAVYEKCKLFQTRLYIDSPSVARGLRYFSTQES